ncbi:MAG TPA: antibiotic biosynthesis monooxygenase [Planctomycetaceae bacterium]|nr:antibiotic biosynthesis monooxygenase [Planctomycetaceae bacterium]
MIHVTATAYIVKGRRQEFIREFNANIPNVLTEKGCIQYIPTVDLVSGIERQIPPEEDTVVIIEQWKTIEDLEKHLVAPHMLEYRERVKDLVRSAELRITTSQLNSENA